MRRPPVPLVVLLASALLTAAATAFVAHSTRARDQARFENAVQATRDRIEARLDAYTALLRGMDALFAASEQVTAQEFHDYVEQLDVARRYPGVQGIGYSVRVPPEEAGALVAQRRAQGVPDFHLWPGTPRPEVHTILFLEPMDRRNRAALGYDMFTEPTRREAMARARDTGGPALSGRVTLVQEIEGPPQAGFLLYLPVYRGGRTPEGVEARRQALEGFVYSPFRADDLFAGIFGTEREPRVSFQVYDGTEVEQAALLHDSRGPRPGRRVQPAAFTSRAQLTVAGRPWTLTFQSRPSFEWASHSVLPLTTAGVGALVTLALYLVTLAQARARQSAERTAAALQRSLAERQRTEAALRLSEARLRLLSEASHLLAEALEAPEALLQRVARLAVASLASVCVMDLLEEDGALRRVASAHHLPEQEDALGAVPPLPGALEGDSPLAAVVREGRDVLLAELTDEARGRVAASPAHLLWMERLDVRSVLLVALRARGRVLGVLCLAACGAARRFDADDLSMAGELAFRAASALDNARLYREAQEAVRLRDEFLSVAGHELRTPLTSLSLRLGGLVAAAGTRAAREGDGGPAALAERVERDVQVAQRQVRRLTDLIAQLLDVSRLSQGTLPLQREEVDLAVLVREVVGVLAPQAARAGSPVALQLEGAAVGRWDRSRLEQVVTNLLSNALKYGAGRPVHVRLEREGGRVRLTVRDEGIGIAPEALGRIFGRFERAVSERHYGGLGLGLFITRQIVEAHGGTISAHSEPGRGATFVVELPLEPQAPREEARA